MVRIAPPFLLAFAWLACPAQASGQPDDPPIWTELALPGPAADLAAAAGIPAPVDPLLVMLEVIRVAHARPSMTPAGEPALSGLLRYLDEHHSNGNGAGAHTRPLAWLPLGPAVWENVIFRQSIAGPDLAGEILKDRDAALLYYGLASLDDHTLRFLAANPDLLATIYRRHAAVFAAFGRSLRVRGDQIEAPGGPEVRSIWERLVGAPADQPARFVQALLRRDRGRLAFFFDTLAHLDEPRLRFALASAAPSDVRLARVRALYRAVRRSDPDWHADIYPFTRSTQVDVQWLLTEIAIAPDGQMAPPSSRWLWEGAFGRRRSPAVADSGDREPVDAAWLAEHVLAVSSRAGRARFETLLFAQRVFGTREPDPDLIAVLRVFPNARGLLLGLERLGVTDPRELVRAVEVAADLASAAPRSPAALTQFQAALAILERARLARTLGHTETLRLVRSLLDLGAPPAGNYKGALARWIDAALLAALDSGPAAAAGETPAEAAVLAAMAGVRPGTAGPVVTWEGRRYRADPAAAELARLKRLRAAGGGPALDAALRAFTTPASASTRVDEDPERQLAGVLASIVYAAQLGDPGGPAARAGVVERHDFGLYERSAEHRLRIAWDVPQEQMGSGSPWHVRGSLLGLDVALARLALRRMDIDRLPAPPALSEADRTTLALTVALTNPFELADADRDAIVAAVRRGRARVATLAGAPGGLDAIAGELRLDGLRRRELSWLLEGGAVDITDEFSLGELLWLGRPAIAPDRLRGWGMAAVARTGCLCLEMPPPVDWAGPAGRPTSGQLATHLPDLKLRIAEGLAELRLPAALMPGVLAVATQELIDEARPANPSDWLRVARHAQALPLERIEDYVASLAGAGALVPAGDQMEAIR